MAVRIQFERDRPAFGLCRVPPARGGELCDFMHQRRQIERAGHLVKLCASKSEQPFKRLPSIECRLSHDGKDLAQFFGIYPLLVQSLVSP